ncbi:MAG: hypothetical protein IPJ03_17345 [Ignavibacteriales bacterium]|nr:hypothetical protein [Ignavibacteriales bacterium]
MPDKKINIVFNAVGDAAAQKMKEVTAGIDQVQKTALRTTPTIKREKILLNEYEQDCSGFTHLDLWELEITLLLWLNK